MNYLNGCYESKVYYLKGILKNIEHSDAPCSRWRKLPELSYI